jgi:hypothetical protein
MIFYTDYGQMQKLYKQAFSSYNNKKLVNVVRAVL